MSPMRESVTISLLLACSLAGLVSGGEKDTKPSNDSRRLALTRHSVEARVIYPNRPLGPTIQAELQPGPFTIPEGYKAVDLKFHSGDPKTGYESDVLRPGNIKCVKSKRPPTKEGFKAGMELAAGEYLLIVGGFPGASGALAYTLVPDDTQPKDKKPGDGDLEGSPILYRGVWLPEKYFPPGYSLYPGYRFPPGDPAQGNSSQSLWYGIPLQRKRGSSSSSAGDHPYTVFVDGIIIFKTTALAKKFFRMWKEGPPAKTNVALGEEAYIDDNCKDAGTLFKEYRGKAGVFRRDLNVRNIRIGRMVFGLRVIGQQVEDFNPNAPGHRHFIAHPLPSREDVLRIAEAFVNRIQQYGKDRSWLEDP